jgi:ribosomal protein S18 acetylase RimI-like enzyme
MASENVKLRDARPEEVEAVLALWRAAYEPSSVRSTQEDIPALLAHGPSARLIVAELGGGIVGSLIVTFDGWRDGWRGNMYRLAVHPGRQRRGIACCLVDEAHEWLRGRGCRRITALVEGDHGYATSFWESAGYRYDAGMRRYLKDIE